MIMEYANGDHNCGLPNAMCCEHGHQRGKCPECDAAADIADLTVALEAAESEARVLRCEVEWLRVGHDRYETARRMNPQQWLNAWEMSIRTGKPFDEIIDNLRSFIEPNGSDTPSSERLPHSS